MASRATFRPSGFSQLSRIARWNPKFHRGPPCPRKESKGSIARLPDCQRLTKEGQSAISSGIRNRCWCPSAHHQHLSDGAVISPLDREGNGLAPHTACCTLAHSQAGNAHRSGCGPTVRCDHFAKKGAAPVSKCTGLRPLVQVGRWGGFRGIEGSLGEGLHPQSRANVASNRLRLPPRISAAICWQADGHRARNFRGRKFSSSKQEQRRQPRGARSGRVRGYLGILSVAWLR